MLSFQPNEAFPSLSSYEPKTLRGYVTSLPRAPAVADKSFTACEQSDILWAVKISFLVVRVHAVPSTHCIELLRHTTQLNKLCNTITIYSKEKIFFPRKLFLDRLRSAKDDLRYLYTSRTTNYYAQ
jgi:hypothetical protein